jgi:hypothetical protein
MLFTNLKGSLEGNLSLANASKTCDRDPLTVFFIFLGRKFCNDILELLFSTDKLVVLSKWNTPVRFRVD